MSDNAHIVTHSCPAHLSTAGYIRSTDGHRFGPSMDWVGLCRAALQISVIHALSTFV